MMKAVLSNADHPEYGVATIPLPVPRNQYDHCVALLEALEIGDASEADCRLDSLDSAWPVLNQLVCTKVNLDELDYLAKRLDSFDVGESSQFQVMDEKLNLTSMKALINLTFCCQQATVITDFTNLKEVGRDHYMNIHGGCASMYSRKRRPVKLSYRFCCCGIYPRTRRNSRPMRRTFLPFHSTFPLVASRFPVMIFIMVLLPAPLGPKRP